MDPREKLKILTAAALIDGTIDIAERELIDDLASRLGIPPPDVVALIAELRSGAKLRLQLKGLDEAARRAIITQLTTLIAADGQVTDRELAFTQSLGASLGIPPTEIQALSEKALAHRSRAIRQGDGHSISQLIEILARVL